jgi:hypothetical protein
VSTNWLPLATTWLQARAGILPVLRIEFGCHLGLPLVADLAR